MHKLVYRANEQHQKEHNQVIKDVEKLNKEVKEIFERLDTLLLLFLAANPQMVANMPSDIKAAYNRMKGDEYA